MIRYLWSFGNTRIVFKEKSQMKSSGGLLFTAWLLLMAWCLFSNRVSTATVVGNGYLQVVTCEYLIFCSLDKYKLLVPHQVCAFAQKRLIELKSTLVGGARGLINFRPRSAELPPLLSHGCPIIGRAAPMHFYTNCSDWAQIWWENPGESGHWQALQQRHLYWMDRAAHSTEQQNMLRGHFFSFQLIQTKFGVPTGQ